MEEKSKIKSEGRRRKMKKQNKNNKRTNCYTTKLL